MKLRVSESQLRLWWRVPGLALAAPGSSSPLRSAVPTRRHVAGPTTAAVDPTVDSAGTRTCLESLRVCAGARSGRDVLDGRRIAAHGADPRARRRQANRRGPAGSPPSSRHPRTRSCGGSLSGACRTLDPHANRTWGHQLRWVDRRCGCGRLERALEMTPGEFETLVGRLLCRVEVTKGELSSFRSSEGRRHSPLSQSPSV